jgi:phosphosulfolactate synthase
MLVHQEIHHSKQTDLRPASTPDFLVLPERSAKPRSRGLSHVLDNGISPAETKDRLDAAGASIDLWKFGWGIAYLDPHLADKIELLDARQVVPCPGGTLLEIAWRQGRFEAFLDWAESAGFPAVEVSNGSVSMTREEKDDLIRTAADRFEVLAEVGRKDPALGLTPEEWSENAAADIAAGARWVVAEGRESGTVGLFTPEGRARTDVVDAIVDAVGLERVLFEAPQRSQQAWLIRRFGPEVNLGNIAVGDALALETLRLGLRTDTLDAAFVHDPTREAER